HGFSAWKHHQADATFPLTEQVVLTDAADDHYDPPHLVGAQQALAAAGYRSHIVDFATPTARKLGLGALPTVEHKDMVARGLVGAEFNHIEIDTSLRRGPDADAAGEKLLDVLAPVYRPA